MNPLDKLSELPSNFNPLLDPPKKEKPVEVKLTNEQCILILKKWDENPDSPPSISDLTRLTFPDMPEENYDSRKIWAKVIKEYLTDKLGSESVKQALSSYKPPKLELTDPQKEYIKNNGNFMNSFEMAKELFKNCKLSFSSAEVRLVKDYWREIKPPSDEDDEIGEYSPPNRIEHAASRINKHVDGANFDIKKLTPSQKKQCAALMNYMRNLRFIHHLNLIIDKDDRLLFENTFIRYVYDKTDLSQEDLDQYLTLANEAVMESSIKRTITMLENEQQRSLDETGKISMTIVDAIKTSRDEYNACRRRQDSLYKALDVERSKRMNERIGPQFTLLSIVEEMKNEERRKALVQDAEKRNEKIKSELERLSTMEERFVRLYGIDEDLAING